MHRIVSTKAELAEHWAGNTNFLLAGDCVPYDFDFPPADELIDILRQDPDSRILKGGPVDDHSREDLRDSFRALPIRQALQSRFHLSHFKLAKFYDGPLAGFEEHVMEPWRAMLAEAGFTWQRCYPILFISGPGCGSSYHMDVSHVVAWQVYGLKRFCGFREPERYAPLAQAVQRGYRDNLTRPACSDEQLLCYEQTPGVVLWNQLLTPHWVEAGDEVAVSLNISHGFLRHDGQLCGHEAALDAWWDAHPEEAWR